ncbi:hypothetical protein [Rhodoferax sp.]|uniref:hypothetical protein n=1 Tax=Rhodoferax sp. TaxID=50421 RepID=UPI00260BE64C|nr:hypothetical protein [Rhodoferax sp.]MDD2917468.1 hypothetical protein [Rhodoferax sp.]
MYNAPAVTYPVGRSRFQTGLTMAIVLAGGVAQAAWWLLSTAHSAGHLLGLSLWLVAGSWALWCLSQTVLAQLVWDGRDWSWCSGKTHQVVVPQVIVDTQHSLLLCLHPATGATKWAWPAQQAQPERWLALRRALFNPSAEPVEPDPARLTAMPEA